MEQLQREHDALVDGPAAGVAAEGEGGGEVDLLWERRELVGLQATLALLEEEGMDDTAALQSEVAAATRRLAFLDTGVLLAAPGEDSVEHGAVLDRIRTGLADAEDDPGSAGASGGLPRPAASRRAAAFLHSSSSEEELSSSAYESGSQSASSVGRRRDRTAQPLPHGAAAEPAAGPAVRPVAMAGSGGGAAVGPRWAEQVRNFQDVCGLFDVTGDGTVPVGALRSLFQILGHELSPDEIGLLLAQLGTPHPDAAVRVVALLPLYSQLQEAADARGPAPAGYNAVPRSPRRKVVADGGRRAAAAAGADVASPSSGEEADTTVGKAISQRNGEGKERRLRNSDRLKRHKHVRRQAGYSQRKNVLDAVAPTASVSESPPWATRRAVGGGSVTNEPTMVVVVASVANPLHPQESVGDDSEDDYCE
jgi:hypothetical protein